MKKGELEERIRASFIIMPKDLPPSFSINPIAIRNHIIDEEFREIFDGVRKDIPTKKKAIDYLNMMSNIKMITEEMVDRELLSLMYGFISK